MAFSGIGIVAGAALTHIVRRAGADHVEPGIAGNLVHRDGDGWRLDPAYDDERFGSFALFVPPDLSLLTEDPDVVDGYLRAVLPIVALVATSGARIVFGSGTARTAPPDMPMAQAHERFARVVRVARDLAATHDLRIVLEPLNRDETNVVHTIEQAVAFLDAFDLQGVSVVADLFHVQAEHESFDVVRSLADRIGHVHVSDRDRLPPGEGDWPWPEFLAAVHQGGYRGPVSLECRWSDDPEPQMDAALRAVRAAAPH
ncbi:sugar phosphate isomerase/epimerase [Curtobacterium sp. VKM Ac-2922]|uniref:sugar phosphate isomerase/epimerase family protein n=1 Tax=Curtobacterium sp. VKM Ac-2922 TaxID=2929475 RepID=UPI001FB383CC|nr:sugar phosphate isomerase/epimerase family protein [Curtobacterium sp. VKM Ac-2922]MCJ1712830.1 sugar phosphate isomerase/epimerase [Curtobacterium sp. VKM Ac-2922]